MIGNRSAEHRLGTMENQSRHAETVLGAPVLQRSQKGLTGHGRGASCPRSQAAERDKAFGLWFFPAKDIK